ncbi:hypothetical protein CYMTET_9283 [Cymbomonas tetramitiformis]|uniref:Uncharacterized protein n=1 Tax=Cymbomonas tetramitiformis TaxID=36881 RepID=A0AAE0GRD8_9CHLO|nr:hypothetical protein CYMTET_9283 [Cymbomonas tetramitiformis]
MDVKSIRYQLVGAEEDAPSDERIHENVVRAVWIGARECPSDSNLLDNIQTTDRIFRLVDHTTFFQYRPGRPLEEAAPQTSSFPSWREVELQTIVAKRELHKFTATFNLDTMTEPLIDFQSIPAFTSWKTEPIHRELVYSGGRDANSAISVGPDLLEVELADNLAWKESLPTGSFKSVDLPSLT